MKNVLAVLRRAHIDNEGLSAYADGQLDARQRAVVEAHLATCGRCHAQLDALRAIRSALSSLPEIEPPRSFHLRPGDVTRPVRAPAPSFALRAAPALGAAALVAFAVLVAVDVRSGGGAQPQAARSSGELAARPMTPQDLGAQSKSAAGVPTAGGGAAPAPAGALAATPVAGDQAAGNYSQSAPPAAATPALTRSGPAASPNEPSPPAAGSAADSVAPTAAPEATRSRNGTQGSDRAWLRWAEAGTALIAAGLGIVAVRGWIGGRRRS